ncbi:restriction endonuclease subunit S [Limnospira platensis CENA597]|uniref:restriction endonuclease subunit S n=1 Tax=Limnospira platensis TaxID=118562 RepID=UPI003DA00C67
MSRQELAGNNNQVPPGEGMGYKKSAIGLIPEDWEVKQLKNIAPLQRGFDLPTSQLKKGSYPVVYSNGVMNYHAQFIVSSPGVITGRSGTIGNVHYIEQNYWPHNTTLWVTSFINSHPKYIYYLYTSIKLARFGTGSGVPTLNRNDVHELNIAIPPLPEQKAIASVLSDVDELISSLDKLIAKKRHIKTATMQQLLTGKTRLPGFGEGKGYKKSAKGMGYKKSAIGLIPEDWEVKQIHQIIEVDPENLISKTHPDYEFKYISLEDVNNGYLSSYSNQTFSKAPSRARRILRYQDILFATVRPNLKSHLFFNKNESDWICSTGFAVLRCKENQSSSGFIFAYLFGRAITSQIETLISGSNYPAVNNNDVKHLKILLPPLPEQKAIASVLSDMDKEIAALEKRRAKTQGIKQGMMQELLTGRTRIINNYNGE